MITNDRLDIFRNFVIDRSLPKNKPSNDSPVPNGNMPDQSNWTGITGRFASEPSPQLASEDNRLKIFTYKAAIDYCDYRINALMPHDIRRLYYKLLKAMYVRFGSKRNYMKTDMISIHDFFSGLKDKSMILSSNPAIMDHYEKVLQSASSNGQVALAERLIAQRFTILGEITLMGLGVKKYLTEEQIVKFYKKIDDVGKANLKLTWIKNFARVIPSEVTDLKTRMDNSRVFDNYVILHYDPSNTAVKDTVAEIEKKKDPILFGVIAGSNRLYFLADWVDEVCDLTLDKLLETIGEKSLTINNKSVTTYINTVTA